MNKLKNLILLHPTRYKYILIIVDIFFILVATKIFINYNNIKIAIQETKDQSEYKKMELSFTENFQLPYEKSEYASFFLKHENNVLSQKEFIIKFQEIVPSTNINTGDIKQQKTKEIDSPQESRKAFFYKKINR